MNKMSLLFPGHGSQYSGMGKKWLDVWMVPRIFEQASDTLGFDMKRACLDGDVRDLARTEMAQPVILTAGYIAFQVIMEQLELEPAFLAGHSLGEFTALTCAEALRFEDALKIVSARGRLMKQASAQANGSIIAVMGVEPDLVEAECEALSRNGGYAAVSNYNSKDQLTISGDKETVAKAVALLESKGARFMEVNIDAPYHTPLMEMVVQPLKEELRKYPFFAQKYPVISNTKALPFDSGDDLIDSLSRQIVNPVRWHDSIRYMFDQGITRFLEVGPQAILRNLFMINEWDAEFYSFDDRRDEALVREMLSAADPLEKVDKERKLELAQGCLAEAVCTANLNGDAEAYRTGVVLPYQRLKAWFHHAKKTDSDITFRQLKRALQTLKTVMAVKGVPQNEQRQRFRRILFQTGLFDYFEEYLHT